MGGKKGAPTSSHLGKALMKKHQTRHLQKKVDPSEIPAKESKYFNI
jgi:hypothetical protein